MYNTTTSHTILGACPHFRGVVVRRRENHLARRMELDGGDLLLVALDRRLNLRQAHEMLTPQITRWHEKLMLTPGSTHATPTPQSTYERALLNLHIETLTPQSTVHT